MGLRLWEINVLQYAVFPYVCPYKEKTSKFFEKIHMDSNEKSFCDPILQALDGYRDFLNLHSLCW